VKHSVAPPGFLLLLAIAAAFIIVTGGNLPPTVASHFGASGAADGFMPRTGYLAVMLAVTVALPLLLALLHGLVIPVHLINVPNREYWLAPERRAETFAYLHAQTLRLARLLVVFLCYVHLLIVRAHTALPPRLSSPLLIAGLFVFFAALVVGLVMLVVHFRRRP
jgi:uncharacterized membrane protein